MEAHGVIRSSVIDIRKRRVLKFTSMTELFDTVHFICVSSL